MQDVVELYFIDIYSLKVIAHSGAARIQFQSPHRNGKYSKWKNTNLTFSVSMKKQIAASINLY